MHTPLNDEQRRVLLEAQLASLANGDETLAGTNLSTKEHGWWVLDGIVVRDESGQEQELLRRLLPGSEHGTRGEIHEVKP
jgi:hypothetical protein